MAMRYSPNGGAGSRTVVIKLLRLTGQFFGSFSLPRIVVLEQVVFAGKNGI